VENVQNAPNAQNVQNAPNAQNVQNAPNTILINISVKIHIAKILTNLEKIRGL
jgi:hypothetical protein